MKNLIAIMTGLIFGVGLASSGMTDTNKVQGFLDIFGAWDASLLLVLGGALGTTLITFNLLLRRNSPLLSDRFFLPIKASIDKPLVFGSITFGIGWALVGYCPGPAIAALAYLQWQTLVFVGCMLLGGFVARKLDSNQRYLIAKSQNSEAKT